MRRLWIAAALGVTAAIELAASVLASAPGDNDRYRFVVNVSLSPAAAETLKERKEGITVFAAWQGDPIDSKQRYAGDDGLIGLGNEEVPLSGRQVVIDGRNLDRKHLAWVREPLLSIAVYSARHSEPDNILDCKPFDDSFAKAHKAPVVITCKLIGEVES